MYIDTYGIIVQQDGDAGDSLHREGMYAFGKWLIYHEDSGLLVVDDRSDNREPAEVMDQFEVEPGIYVRHPDAKRWSANPATTSRDQIIPVIAYCAAAEDYGRLGRLFAATALRGFFAQNTIPVGPGRTERKIPDTMLGHIGLFIRAGGYWTAPLYPLLLVTDTIDLLGTLVSAIPIHFVDGFGGVRWRGLGDVDDNNTIIGHLVAAEFKPTPISWLNRQLYALTRSENFGNTVSGERNPVMGAMVWYHRAEAGGNPEMAELYRPAIEKYLSPYDDLSELHLQISLLLNHLDPRAVLAQK